MAKDKLATDEEPPTPSKKLLLIGLVLSLVGAAGGFYVTWSGAILGASSGSGYNASVTADSMDMFTDIAFVEIDPMTISINGTPDRQMLRFRAQLEVPAVHQQEVTKVLPRVVDVLNSYLRALEITDFEEQTVLIKLRAQMLRRVQIVTGPGRVNDFLIMEFVLT